ncbi:MAG: PolC-type DNA polymerase III [Eubacteriales bacterium]|nr:PolC-type DNA polymerase III [Eubacteriales bacterium]
MRKGDFFDALKSHVNIDACYDLRFEKIQHDVKKGEFLVYFTSNLLPVKEFLLLEQYIKDTVGEKARLFVVYRDAGDLDSVPMQTHIKELCCHVNKALTPFIARSKMYCKGGAYHIDFADDFGKELFAASGLSEYLCGYIGGCFGMDVRIVPGRYEDMGVADKPDKKERVLLDNVVMMPKPKKPTAKKEKPSAPNGMIHGRRIPGDVICIRDIDETTGLCTVSGEVISVNSFNIKDETRGKKSIVVFSVTDRTSSVTCKAFVSRDKLESILSRLKSAAAVKVAGSAGYDAYSKEICLMAKSIEEAEASKRQDNAEIKRVELHMHTNMSALDAVADEADVVRRAAEFGHEAVAITDHGVVQAFPVAFDTAKKLGVKVIYGMEAYMIDDIGDVYKEEFEDEYVVFDLETTGFNPLTNGITEIGAVRIRRGEVVDTFNTFVNPGQPISRQITDTTGITNEMVADAPCMGEALLMFKQYIGGAHLAAHNAPFDMSFLAKHGDDNGIVFDNECLDTLGLFRRTLPGYRSYSLGKLAGDLGIELNHHRALDDALCTAQIMKMAMDAVRRSPGRIDIANLNSLPNYHVILLCKNAQGLFNLYKLVSESHLKYFYRRPRVPKSLLIKHREGLIVGSACEQGELIQAILRFASDGELQKIALFYDYLEVQPDGNNAFMIREGRLRNIEGVRDITRKIVALGETLSLPVVATCDAHFLEPQDEYFRRILMYGQGYTDADNQAPLYFRTTDEMLSEFSYLGEEKAREIVIDNTRAVAAETEDIKLLPDEPAMPEIPGAAEKLQAMAFDNARALYGDPLPPVVEERLVFELEAIIKHGYGVLYYIAYELVRHSLDDGYLVGSRGSVGSSFAATMAGITEVNPLPPHYVCPDCRHSDFDVDSEVYACGPDLPSKSCPVCGADLGREGFHIPFAVFLGINADKVPDIDLNFSGLYQPEAHKFILEYFGEDHVFRAGTISTIKDQTAYGFVKAYIQEKGIAATKAEINRLTQGVSGTKRTTGQHPGGLIILPKNRDIHEFTPIQYPANDMKATSVTTHYNFGSLHDRLIKLDILGHDDPTALHMLQDITGIDPKNVPINDKATLSLFSSPDALGLKPDQIMGCKVGSLGIPEFGTKFVRQMLVETRPTTIGELVRISGLSHGTDVWLNNAAELIRQGTATLREAICTRDDIMNYLMSKGMDATQAFYIMESVRKGSGVSEAGQKGMREAGVPEWFIDSCQKIKYMFPKAHAVAYVTMALRIAYFKVHHPRAFYATYFSVRADNLDARYLHSGETVRAAIAKIEAQGKSASALELSQLTILEVALEMIERGIDFLPVDLYRSDAVNCIIESDGIRLPFTALGNTGEAAAKGIATAREAGKFISVEDLKARAGISSAVVQKLEENGCLRGLIQSNQLSLFDL